MMLITKGVSPSLANLGRKGNMVVDSAQQFHLGLAPMCICLRVSVFKCLSNEWKKIDREEKRDT